MTPADLSTLQAQVRSARSMIDQRKGQRDQLLTRQAELTTQVADARTRTSIITDATVLLRAAADAAREQTRERIESLVTGAMVAVFGAGYAVKLLAGESGGRPTIQVRIITPYEGGESLETGIDSNGGGVLDIVTTMLRMAMLQLSGRPGPLFLDEPARHVSADNIQHVGALFRESGTRFGRQILYVTHNEHLAALADQVHRVELRDGASVVTSSAAA